VMVAADAMTRDRNPVRCAENQDVSRSGGAGIKAIGYGDYTPRDGLFEFERE